MADRVALYLQDAHSLQDAIKYVQYAESRGFEAVWQAESRLVRDAIVPMAAFAATTSRIKIGSGVINNWTRNAAVIAATYLTLDDLAPDRIICGIGAWWDPLAKKVGIDRSKPLLAMREVVTVVRDLLARKRVTFHGEFHHRAANTRPRRNDVGAFNRCEHGFFVGNRRQSDDKGFLGERLLCHGSKQSQRNHTSTHFYCPLNALIDARIRLTLSRVNRHSSH